MPAIAFSNNDIAVVAWTFDRHLDGCLGFAIHQIDVDAGNKETVLPALARFANQDKAAKFTTEQAPVQKFWWKDLYAKRGGTYQYRIVPMGGQAGSTLTPLAGVAPLLSNKVTLTPSRPPFSAYFNRGITATQALSEALGGHPNVDELGKHITDPNDPIRIRLMGQLQEGVTSLLARADKDGGIIHAALYELNDPNGLEKQLQANPHSRNVILGNEQSNTTDDSDKDNRDNLKAAGVNVIDRILGKGDIPHNKFMVLTENNTPTAVLSGSTNWTSTGLCTQTNNALIIESKDVAQRYIDYWNALKADVDAAHGNKNALQSKTLRDYDHSNNAGSISSPIDLGNGVSIETMFSPNTPHKLSKNPDTPNDMGRVFALMAGAKQAILFLAFDPGNNSILDEAGKMLAKNPDLFVRGALTSPQRAVKFSEALHAGSGSDTADDGAPHKGPHVTVVGEPGKPKKAGEPTASIDYRAVPAGAVTAKDAPGAWEGELAKYGFAIIHNKIVVIDPFSDDCVVVTGSHNLGFRASHNNDENMVIVRGHRGLAEAYACHVLDLYDHYAWRFLLSKHPDVFGQPLEADDKWQERYIQGPDVKSPELRFWLAAAGGRVTPAARPSAQAPAKPKPSASTPAAAPADPAPAKPAARKARKARKAKPAKKAPKKAAKARKAAKKTKKRKAAKKPKAKKAKAKKASKKAAKKRRR
ncbi:MAG TPA: phospholipase D-like domain-containing protein [Bradyrhizobium sp.]|uniref:phospholipase D-like domain-containing protein n=1 Tax=Bradyrhizobium sp. TaxID=376 RepID=UPI002C1D9DB1|nr:phospholipase D-like domain-containing protein [Bradyrhizobium sp.]HLZ05371.1 phospholipase D-like domain-containing protein [Bradyrhizobium sp.]